MTMKREPNINKGPSRIARRIRGLAYTSQWVETLAGHIRPIAPDTLLIKIVNSIAELMMQGVWRPGDLISPESDLALRLGVGRSTIRNTTMLGHSAVVDAITAANPERAAEMMQEQITLAAERLRRVMENRGDEARNFPAVSKKIKSRRIVNDQTGTRQAACRG